MQLYQVLSGEELVMQAPLHTILRLFELDMQEADRIVSETTSLEGRSSLNVFGWDLLTVRRLPLEIAQEST